MKKAQRILGVLAVSALTTTTAFATNGYFAHGYGTATKGMAGAGVALPQDAMAASINPAGMVHVGNRMDIGAALFIPLRSYAAGTTGSAFTDFVNPDTNVDSDRNFFLIPSFGYNHMIDDKSSIGISVYGNGGMNTFYDATDTAGGGGTFDTILPGSPGNTGVDLMQLFIAPTYSRMLSDKVSVGVSALIAYQRFKAHGLSEFSILSSDPTALSENNYDDSFGYGARIGILAQVSDRLSLGASYQSRVYMEEFSKYAGLFAEQGDFDIPSNFSIGLAFKAAKDVTITADVQHIMYSEIAAIANPIDLSTQLGDDNGSGFGWDDMTIFKLGAQWQYNPTLTLRGGISYGEQPIPADQVMFNIIAPAVMETHLTAGFTKQLDKDSSFSVAGMWAPENSQSGTSPFGQPIEITMQQFEVEVSYGKTWN